MASEATQPVKDQNQSLEIEPIALRVPEACRYLGIGRSTLYVLISKSEVEIIKLGSSTLVLTESLKGLVERKRETFTPRAAIRES
ncbi:MAG: helix-turn-helix domain-containing protein [Qipengyuania citrea]|uniref:helix-turn-helix domain-containing protein n=2 Tax=Sphingomonadales TaxID=204457 RepID=UPI003267CEFE